MKEQGLLKEDDIFAAFPPRPAHRPPLQHRAPVRRHHPRPPRYLITSRSRPLDQCRQVREGKPRPPSSLAFRASHRRAGCCRPSSPRSLPAISSRVIVKIIVPKNAGSSAVSNEMASTTRPDPAPAPDSAPCTDPPLARFACRLDIRFGVSQRHPVPRITVKAAWMPRRHLPSACHCTSRSGSTIAR